MTLNHVQILFLLSTSSNTCWRSSSSSSSYSSCSSSWHRTADHSLFFLDNSSPADLVSYGGVGAGCRCAASRVTISYRTPPVSERDRRRANTRITHTLSWSRSLSRVSETGIARTRAPCVLPTHCTGACTHTWTVYGIYLKPILISARALSLSLSLSLARSLFAL